MKFASTLVLCFAMVAALSAEQKTTAVHPGRGGSPHVRTEWSISGANLSIEYGRPYVKGRTIGKELAPFGYVWRAGADEATTLKSDKALAFGSLTVPAGAHTLWVLPAADKWQLIVNKNTGQWGTDYNEKADIGRVDMKVEKIASPVEQLTFSIEPAAGGGVLKIEFGPYRASVPFAVK
jgi:hypothetical protein